MKRTVQTSHTPLIILERSTQQQKSQSGGKPWNLDSHLIANSTGSTTMQTHLTLWLSCVAAHLIKTHLTRFTAARLCVSVRIGRIGNFIPPRVWAEALLKAVLRQDLPLESQWLESGFWYQGLTPKQHKRGRFYKVSHCSCGYIREHYTKCTGGETDLSVSQGGKGVSSSVMGKPQPRQWDHSKCKR